ncbi:ABC transporter ATP-binding protein [Actinoplanes lobatus]|uniref:ABC transporter ATP-binding protein n=1 Tax=Actinoplanes lobatus TaxID=113568 RepID=A0A7W7HAL8_9ACTN|nr:ABC transporter ATP-binding protein [Actinoplanes lobatus]MBB4746948.1 ABC-2 type transport system ATP-binding protein [Actinoplanes lobatus]GGN54996.1 ABC transporter ATP-binding protein [Actinoplanes lobatus]GIE41770.1 ABC transporter ATP-binding protein [Actinoplanes lobatus]
MSRPNHTEISVEHLTKQYSKVRAVDDLSFTVHAGRVTGFLGPNGAGKTTTLRMILGLVTPTSGTATIGGVRYTDLPDPIRHVGAILEASSAHRGRSARNHLRVICRAAGLPDRRADEVLEMVGLQTVGGRKFKGYSLGMKQRLGIAAAMLGDPRVLILDEPTNGLDPEGIRWMRDLLKAFAAEGRAVLVSSHLLGEMQQLADDVVIIAAGRLIRQGPVSDVLGETAGVAKVRVRTPQAEQLSAALRDAQLEVAVQPDGSLQVLGADPARVGNIAFTTGVELHELIGEGVDLERAFLELTAGKAGAR